MVFSSSSSSTFPVPETSSSSWKRRATILGGLYIVGKYVKDRLDDTKELLMQERVARDNLKRRFHTNQQNVSYTVLALISTLSEQISEGMDVEAVTSELQSLSSRKTVVAAEESDGQRNPASHGENANVGLRAPLPSNPDPGATSLLPPPPAGSTATPSTPSDALSLSLPSAAPSSPPETDAHSDVGSTSTSQSIVSSEFSPTDPSTNDLNELNLSQSSTSWMTDNVSMNDGASPIASSMELINHSEPSDQHLVAPPDPLAQSYIRPSVQPPDVVPNPPVASGRTKVELWNEIKILAITRTLTTLYSTTLLSLFTSLQLTLLSRAAYVHSIQKQAKDEEQKENMMLMFGGGGLVGMSLAMCPIKSVRWFMGTDGGFDGGGPDPSEEQLFSLLQQGDGLDGVPLISEEVERKYLTLSWWMLHVGWKDVGERVRKGVEDVLDGVSLKTKLGIIDLHRLISDIRRRVEHEITFEGRERRIDFLSTLLPPTPEMTQRVLSEGGFFPSSSPLSNPHFPPLPGSGFSQSGMESPPEPSITSFEESHRIEDEAHLQHSAVTPAYVSPEDKQFQQLLDETQQTIASPDFARVLEVCMERAVEALFDDLEKDIFFPHSQAQAAAAAGLEGDDSLAGGEEVRIRLAALLPGLTRWSKDVLNGLPNVLVDTLMNTREVAALSAIVFSKFEDEFI
ncbi:hypothetical protein ONZ45_g15682 [Pleurotus djamor]|nr:hypothetical protein ONZ45_g15682 [Pleurotus djamor]